MKLTVFHSDKGDCCLLTSRDGKRILVDGGMAASYTESVAPELTKLRTSRGNKQIDVVYVSHIDEDHISGVLRMLDDAVDWRIFDHKRRSGVKVAEPKSPRPPEIGEIWHNGFREQLGEDSGPIEDQLAASASVLAGALTNASLPAPLRSAVAQHQDLAVSVKQAVQLGRRIRDGQLGIALNKPVKGKLMMVGRPSKPIDIGTMSVHVIGPQAKDLERLREDWVTWLRKSKSVLAAIDKSSRKDEAELAASAFVAPLLADARSAAIALGEAMKEGFSTDPIKALGQRSGVTPPNLASLMLLVVEGKRSVLLTGDGFAGDVLTGLQSRKLLTSGSLHVDVLKVPHHGAAHNMTDDFAMAVTADHYVFCGNGSETNPEIVVIDRLFESRLGDAAKRSKNAQVDNPFTFWFNCSSKVPNTEEQKKHMIAVERRVAALKKKSKGKLTAKFLGPGQASFEIAPPTR